MKKILRTKKRLPTKGLGGLLRDYGVGVADFATGAIGMTDLIDKDDYKTKVGKGFAKYGADMVAPIAAQIGANALAPGVGGALLGGVQQIGGAATAKAPETQAARAKLPQSVTTQSFTPTFKYGGNMKKYNQGGQLQEYSGQSHEGPDEGIPVDAAGNPSATTGQEPVALTEGGEMRWEDYIFSDTIKLPGNKKKTFADEAKRIRNKYKLRLGENNEKKDPIDTPARAAEMEKLMNMQEAAKGNVISKDAVPQQAPQMPMDPNMQMDPSMMDPNAQGGMPMEQMDPAMMEQMAAQQGGQPMMRMGGDLPKYWGGGPYDPEVEGGVGFEDGMTSAAEIQQARQAKYTGTGMPTKDALGNVPLVSIPHRLQDSSTNGNATVAGALKHGVRGKVNPNEKLYDGRISPLAMLPSIAGNVAGLISEHRNKPKKVNLGRVRPEEINSASIEANIRNSGASAMGQLAAAQKQSGATASNYQRGMAGGVASVMNNTGANLANVGMQTQQYNAQARAQANMANMQAAAQEQSQLAYQQNMHDSRNAQYRDNLFAGAGQYMSENNRSMQNAMMMQMMSDNYQIMEQDQGWLKNNFGRNKLRKKYNNLAATQRGYEVE